MSSDETSRNSDRSMCQPITFNRTSVKWSQQVETEYSLYTVASADSQIDLYGSGLHINQSPTVENSLPALGQMQDSRIVHGTRLDCTICVQHSDEAVKFCQDCKATFCENHVRDHYQAPGLMKHTLVEATEGRKTIPNVDNHVHETYVETEQTATQVCSWKTSFFISLLGILILVLALVGLVCYTRFCVTVHGSEVGFQQRIVLLGKSGSEKRASANTILGREAFRVEASPSYGPQCEEQDAVVGRNNITMINTPDVLPSEEVAGKVAQCINISTPHVFLLVIRLCNWCTEEEKKTVKWMNENFAEEALKYTMVLFTGGDQLEGKPVEEYLKDNSDSLKLLSMCGGRHHVFNNKEKDDLTQVTELLEKIDGLLNENRGYYHVTNILTRREEEIRRREEALRKILEQEVRKRDAAIETIREEEEKKRDAAIATIREEEEKRRETEERKVCEGEDEGRKVIDNLALKVSGSKMYVGVTVITMIILIVL
ncbi:GTPase IMAP family member 7-like isoform X1 [Oncorhynchus masou masou]|uniref:GTPase IMAP family member 7-like isoform X1 n=2 Tax=Oncorhynchus masou masou TaxID=90313 RepID=UPI0031841AB3